MADLNQTPSANRVHIAFFGKRNAGKSSVVNAVTGQNLSLVSDVKGTTTDPVQKAAWPGRHHRHARHGRRGHRGRAACAARPAGTQ